MALAAIRVGATHEAAIVEPRLWAHLIGRQAEKIREVCVDLQQVAATFGRAAPNSELDR